MATMPDPAAHRLPLTSVTNTPQPKWQRTLNTSPCCLLKYITGRLPEMSSYTFSATPNTSNKPSLLIFPCLEDGKNCHHNRSLTTFLEPRMLNNLTERLQYRPLWLSRSYALAGCLRKRRNALFHMKGVVRSMQSAFLWLFRS